MVLVNHWLPERHPEWKSQGSQLSLVVTVEDESVREAVGAIQQMIDEPFLDLVTPDELHSTVALMGNVTEIAREQALAMCNQAVSSLSEPFTVALGPPAVFGELVLMFIEPADQIIAIQQRASEVISSFPSLSLVLPALPPHLAIAYANEDRQSSDLATTLAALPGDFVATFEINRFDLVEATRSDHHYRCNAISSVALGNVQTKAREHQSLKPWWRFW